MDIPVENLESIRVNLAAKDPVIGLRLECCRRGSDGATD